jgi:hypothetical protein
VLKGICLALFSTFYGSDKAQTEAAQQNENNYPGNYLWNHPPSPLQKYGQ